MRHFKAACENTRFEWFFLITDLGEELGVWAKHGLVPEFVPNAATATDLKNLIASGISTGFVTTAEALFARASKTPVKVVAGYFGKTIAKILGQAAGSIKSPRDLDGKRIGTLSTAHTSARAVLYINSKLGIRAEPIAVGSLEDRLAAIRAGKIEAFYASEGAALQLVDDGDLSVLLDLADVYPEPYTADVVWAADDLIDQGPDLVASFVNATLETVESIQDNSVLASSLYAKRTGASQALADRAVAELSRFLAPSGRGSGDDLVAAVSGSWQFSRECGAVPKGMVLESVSDAVETKFLPPYGLGYVRGRA